MTMLQKTNIKILEQFNRQSDSNLVSFAPALLPLVDNKKTSSYEKNLLLSNEELKNSIFSIEV